MSVMLDCHGKEEVAEEAKVDERLPLRLAKRAQKSSLRRKAVGNAQPSQTAYESEAALARQPRVITNRFIKDFLHECEVKLSASDRKFSDLAETLGIDRSRVTHIFRRQHNLSALTLVKLSLALEVPFGFNPADAMKVEQRTMQA